MNHYKEMHVSNYLQHECTLIPSLVVSPSCSPACPREELPAGTRHLHWLRLQSAIKEILYELVSVTDCSNPASPGKVCTCHASNNSRCFDEVSSLHVLCSNDPSFPVAPSYQRDVSRPGETITMADCTFIPHLLNGSAVW